MGGSMGQQASAGSIPSQGQPNWNTQHMNAPGFQQPGQQPTTAPKSWLSMDFSQLLPTLRSMMPQNLEATLRTAFQNLSPEQEVNIEAKLLAALEREKMAAVDREDYHQADHYKREIDALLGQRYQQQGQTRTAGFVRAASFMATSKGKGKGKGCFDRDLGKGKAKGKGCDRDDGKVGDGGNGFDIDGRDEYSKGKGKGKPFDDQFCEGKETGLEDDFWRQSIGVQRGKGVEDEFCKGKSKGFDDDDFSKGKGKGFEDDFCKGKGKGFDDDDFCKGKGKGFEDDFCKGKGKGFEDDFCKGKGKGFEDDFCKGNGKGFVDDDSFAWAQGKGKCNVNASFARRERAMNIAADHHYGSFWTDGAFAGSFSSQHHNSSFMNGMPMGDRSSFCMQQLPPDSSFAQTLPRSAAGTGQPQLPVGVSFTTTATPHAGNNTRMPSQISFMAQPGGCTTQLPMGYSTGRPQSGSFNSPMPSKNSFANAQQMHTAVRSKPGLEMIAEMLS